MRILVTGVNGLVGRAIAVLLQQQGHEVVGLGRKKIPRFSGKYLAIDLASPSAGGALQQIKPCDAIVHAAADLRFDALEPAVTAVNCFGTHQLLQTAEKWPIRSFVFLSSIGVLGRPERLPLTEDMAIRPQTVYHAAKVYGEQILSLIAAERFSYHILRLSAPIGPGMPPNRILSVFLARAQAGLPLLVYGDGRRRQNYVDVRDVAKAVSQALMTPGGSLCHIAGAETVSNLEMARLCLQLTGSESSIQHVPSMAAADDEIWDISIERAGKILGYAPRYTLADSIRYILEETACK